MNKKLFEALQGTQIGAELLEELRRLEAEVYDSRNWVEGMTRETAHLAARPIQKLITGITMVSEPKDVEINQCE